jgi:hypothetical protein
MSTTEKISQLNPDIELELRDESSNGKKYAFGGTSQQLIPEMRSSATDTGDKLAKLLICSHLGSE